MFKNVSRRGGQQAAAAAAVNTEAEPAAAAAEGGHIINVSLTLNLLSHRIGASSFRPQHLTLLPTI